MKFFWSRCSKRLCLFASLCLYSFAVHKTYEAAKHKDQILRLLPVRSKISKSPNEQRGSLKAPQSNMFFDGSQCAEVSSGGLIPRPIFGHRANSAQGPLQCQHAQDQHQKVLGHKHKMTFRSNTKKQIRWRRIIQFLTQNRKKGISWASRTISQKCCPINSAHGHQSDKTMSIKKNLIVFILLPEDWISPKFSESPHTHTQHTPNLIIDKTHTPKCLI